MSAYLIDLEEVLLIDRKGTVPPDVGLELSRWSERIAFLYLTSKMPYREIVQIVPCFVLEQIEKVFSDNGTALWIDDVFCRSLCYPDGMIQWLYHSHGPIIPLTILTNNFAEGEPNFNTIKFARENWPGLRVVKTYGPAHFKEMIRRREI